MNPEELDKQFEVMESDPQVQAAAAGTPPAAAKKKRITVAELNKTIDELTELVDVNVLDWLEKLDKRVRHFENAEAEEPDSAVTNVTDRLHAIENVGLENLPSFISDTTERIEKIEHELVPQSKQGTKFVWDHIDALENAMKELADSFLLHLSEVPGEHPTNTQEIEFAKPPEPPAAVSTRAGDIEAVASVCVSMGDVLLIARALRESQDINVMDKNAILNTACRMAGVEVTHGLQIRAGIHNTR